MFITLGIFGLLVLCAAAWAAEPLPEAVCRRIAFLGSSTTDGDTYPLLVRQAFADARLPVPLCRNAGVGGNTTAAIAARVERDVLPFAPTLVVLQTGANDPGAGVTPTVFAQGVGQIAARLQAAGIPLVLLTTSIRDARYTGQSELLVEYNAELPRIAAAYGCRVANAHALQEAARDAGVPVLDADGYHPSFAGHRLIARAILDAMGYPALPVPEKLTLAPLPGVVTPWRLCAADKPLPDVADEAARALHPGRGWKTLTLPERTALPNWWEDQERRRGFAVLLKTRVGAGKHYYGVAVLYESAAHTAWLNTGAGLQAVWLNGARVYRAAESRGWHAGRERIPISLTSGANTLVIDAVDNFFLSVTANNDW